MASRPGSELRSSKNLFFPSKAIAGHGNMWGLRLPETSSDEPRAGPAARDVRPANDTSISFQMIDETAVITGASSNLAAIFGFDNRVNQNNARKFRDESENHTPGYENIPLMDNDDNIESAIEIFAEALEIPAEQRAAFREVNIAFKTGGLRATRNIAEKLERHAKGVSKRENLSSAQTFETLQATDFANADPSDLVRVHAAQRFARAYLELKKSDPRFRSPERDDMVRRARRLIRANLALDRSVPS